jgi:hypothetical protein
MKLASVLRLLNRKIRSADRKAQNPFLNADSTNPFSRPIYTTIVWVETDENPQSDNFFQN